MKTLFVTAGLLIVAGAPAAASPQAVGPRRPATPSYVPPPTIGEVSFPLGALAFPDSVACLSKEGGCTDVLFAGGPPLYPYYGATVDLTDLGLAPGSQTISLLARGPVVPDWPDTVGLDLVLVMNLNTPGQTAGPGPAGQVVRLTRTSRSLRR